MRHLKPQYGPGIILAMTIITGHSALIYAAYIDAISMPLAILLLGGTHHFAYTVFHEAVHGLLGKRLNPILGVILGQLMGVSFTAHRHLHNKSHHLDGMRPHKGPENHKTISNFVQVLTSQYLDFFFRRTAKKSLLIHALCELAAIICWRMILICYTENTELLFVFILTPLFGAAMIYLVFYVFVHKSGQGERITITHLFPEPIHKYMTSLLAFQNYHVVHHIEPQIPFHLYPQRFETLLRLNQLDRHEMKVWRKRFIHGKNYIC